MGNNSRRVLGEETGFSHRQYPRSDGLNAPEWDERLIGYARPENQGGLGPEEYLVTVMRAGDNFYFGVEWPDTSVLTDEFDYVPVEEVVPSEEVTEWDNLIEYLDEDENLKNAAEIYILEHGEHLSLRRLEQAATETKALAAILEKSKEN